MSVNQTIEKKEVGYRFHVAVDRELHVESGTRTPDKITIHASLEGHTDTYEEAVSEMKESKAQIMEEVAQQEQPVKEEKPDTDTKQESSEP